MSKLIHIGIIDDHLVLRQGLITLLKEYENLNVIISANNGKELMEALKTNKPNIILLDIEMPVMNGREAKNTPKVVGVIWLKDIYLEAQKLVLAKHGI
jgi:DNA-binding NarL/FixJ family response regulator